MILTSALPKWGTLYLCQCDCGALEILLWCGRYKNALPFGGRIIFRHVDKLHCVYALMETSCFHGLTLMTKTVNACQSLSHASSSVPLGAYSEVELLDYILILVFNFLRYCHTVSHRDYTVSQFCQPHTGAQRSLLYWSTSLSPLAHLPPPLPSSSFLRLIAYIGVIRGTLYFDLFISDD